MAIIPKLNKEKKFRLKTCQSCGQSFGQDAFAPTKSFLYVDGAIPLCDSCIDNLIEQDDASWYIVNQLCQMVNIPFVPSEWEKVHGANPTRAFHTYAEIFMKSEFDDFGWEDYYQEYKALRAANQLESVLPEINEKKRKEQRERWGSNYDDEALDYLDGLYNGLMTTQNVNGALQVDQAIKLCKISYEVDKRIEEGADFDKLLGSYDKLVKIAEFTPKNAKNINDFDTVGEVLRWMEKRGWRNRFYDRVTRDIVDETIKNFQNFNQRLYINESGIGEEISRRIEALEAAKKLEQRADSVYDESYYGTDKEYELDTYDTEGFADLFREEDDFDADLSGDDDG